MPGTGTGVHGAGLLERLEPISFCNAPCGIGRQPFDVHFVPKTDIAGLFELTQEAPRRAIIMPEGYARQLPR
jgi:hypothetical protein